MVDEAWNIAQRGGAAVSVVQQGSRSVYTIDIWGVALVMSVGKPRGAVGNPAASRLRIVIENGNSVISAFPVQ